LPLLSTRASRVYAVDLHLWRRIMRSPLGLLPRAALKLTALTALTALLSIGCAHEPRADAAHAEVSHAQYAAAERDARLAWLQCRETALAEKAELLELRRRDLVTIEQSLRDIQDAKIEGDALARRLERAELDLARARKNAEEARHRAPAADLPADLSVRRVAPDNRDGGYQEVLRTVQALVDSGQVKAMVRNGRVIFVLPRPIDEADPYSAPSGRRKLRTTDPSETQ
jgi:hypothetical protein